MKLTKSKLKQLIKEELQSVLNEQSLPCTGAPPCRISSHGTEGYPSRGCGKRDSYAPGVSEFGDVEGTVSWSTCVKG